MAYKKKSQNQKAGQTKGSGLIDTQEIERIIKKAKSIKVSMYKTCLPGPLKDKFASYVVYKIGDLETSDNLVSYKGKIFPDSKIISLMKERAIKLNPEIVEKCEREAEQWKHASHVNTDTKNHTR